MTFELSSILHPQLVKVPLEGTTKRETIDELCDMLCASESISNPENFRRTVWDREGQRSTGIGEGLAIPHGKCPGVQEITMAIGIPMSLYSFSTMVIRNPYECIWFVTIAIRIRTHLYGFWR